MSGCWLQNRTVSEARVVHKNNRLPKILCSEFGGADQTAWEDVLTDLATAWHVFEASAFTDTKGQPSMENKQDGWNKQAAKSIAEQHTLKRIL